MNDDIMKSCGFESEVQLVKEGKCPFCREKVDPKRESFRDDLSFSEFQISGLCQSCQNQVFDSKEGDDLFDYDEVEDRFTSNKVLA